MSKDGMVYVLDMESSLADALARRMLDMQQHLVYRQWDMKTDPVAEVQAYGESVKALIISGSGKNINSKKTDPPTVPPELFELNVPVLAICYGMQYLAHLNDVNIVRCWDKEGIDPNDKEQVKKDKGEKGAVFFNRTEEHSILFNGLGNSFPVWMYHNWMLEGCPEGWRNLGSTAKCPVAAIEKDNIFAVQFHPEPHTSLFGKIMLHNFLTYACGLETPYF